MEATSQMAKFQKKESVRIGEQIVNGSVTRDEVKLLSDDVVEYFSRLIRDSFILESIPHACVFEWENEDFTEGFSTLNGEIEIQIFRVRMRTLLGFVVDAVQASNPNMPLAIKVVSKRKYQQMQQRDNPVREIEILSKLKMVNGIIHLEYVFESIDFLYMVFPNAGVEILLVAHLVHTEKDVKNFVSYILDTLQVLHQFGICHGDISPENICVQCNGNLIIWNTLKLTDLGNARIHSRDLHESNAKISETVSNGYLFIGKKEYRAPELYSGADCMVTYCPAAIDLWSLSITALVLSAKKMIWNSTPRPKVDLEPIVDRFLKTQFHRVSVAFHNFFILLLRREPSERLSVQTVRDHPFLASD